MRLPTQVALQSASSNQLLPHVEHRLLGFLQLIGAVFFCIFLAIIVAENTNTNTMCTSSNLLPRVEHRLLSFNNLF